MLVKGQKLMGRVYTAPLFKKLDDLLKHLAELRKVRTEDRELLAFGRKFHKFVNDLQDANIPLTLNDHLRLRNEEVGIKSPDVPTWWIKETIRMKLLTAAQIGDLLGCTTQAIHQRIKAANERGEDLTRPPLQPRVVVPTDNSKWANDIDGVEPYTVYKQALTVLYNIIEKGEGSGLKPTEALRAVETALRFSETKVLERIQEKFTLLDDLGRWILTTLIPQANTRIRQIIREIEAKIKAGEDTRFITYDLRTALRDILPSFPELRDRLRKEGWVREEPNPESEGP
jgi:hypothetical protein